MLVLARADTLSPSSTTTRGTRGSTSSRGKAKSSTISECHDPSFEDDADLEEKKIIANEKALTRQEDKNFEKNVVRKQE